jgi:hypothetical protein
MNSGYYQPLYVPPFDHRHSYLKKMFHGQEPLSPKQTARHVR